MRVAVVGFAREISYIPSVIIRHHLGPRPERNARTRPRYGAYSNVRETLCAARAQIAGRGGSRGAQEIDARPRDASKPRLLWPRASQNNLAEDGKDEELAAMLRQFATHNNNNGNSNSNNARARTVRASYSLLQSARVLPAADPRSREG